MAGSRKELDGQIRSRIKASINGMSVSAIARKTGITRPSISRWFSDTQIPGYFCTAIASLFGVNGHWLLTGEGQPGGRLNTGGQSGPGTESASLEVAITALGNAASAATEVVSNADINHSVRLLSTYKDLQSQLFSRVVVGIEKASRELSDAVEARDIPKARELDKYLAAMIEFCPESKSTMRGLVQRANLALNLGKYEEAHAHFERVLMHDLATIDFDSESFLITIDRYLLTTWLTKGQDAALKACDAVLSVVPESAREQRAFLRYQSGMWLIHGGLVEEGIIRLTKSIPHLSNPVRAPQAKGTIIEGLVLSGAMSLKDGLNSAPQIFPKITTIAWCAAFSEKEEHLRDVSKFLAKSRYRRDDVLASIASYVNAVLQLIVSGDGPSAAELFVGDVWEEHKTSFKVLVRKCQIERLRGDAKASRAYWKKANSEMLSQPRGFSRRILEEAIHYKNAQLLGLAGGKNTIGRSVEDFREELTENGYRFLVEHFESSD